MTIVIDSVGAQSSTTTTSLSFNHTSTGADRFVFVFVYDTNSSGSVSSVTSVTYGGQSLMPLIPNNALTATQVMSTYGTFAQATGSQSVVITRTGSGGSLFGSALSLTGADQAAGINATGTTPGGSASGSVSLTQTVDNCGVIAYVQNTVGTPTFSAGSTLLYNSGGTSIGRTTTFPSTPTGPKTLSWTAGGGSSGAMTVALSPFGTTQTGEQSNFFSFT